MRARYLLPNFRIAVVGAGAIGSYYGAKLAYLGRDVHFLVRRDLRQVRRFGIRIHGKTENIRLPKVNCYTATKDIGPCDLVLIAVKATANEALLDLLPPLLGPSTMLLTLQNGLGNEEFLAANFGAERVLGGLCFVCLNRVSPGVIEHYDHGRLVVGEFNRYPAARTHDVSWEFKRCGVVCSVAEDLGFERWRKLVWNIPFNGLSVVAGGIDTSVILANEQLRGRTLALMDEVIGAANACGYNLPTAIALEQMKRTETLGAYKPSTLIDFEAGKPLEVEAIWGESLRRGVAAGAKMPELQRLYQQLQSTDEAGRSRRRRAAAGDATTSPEAKLPQVMVRNRQRKVRVDVQALQKVAEAAVEVCAGVRADRCSFGSLRELAVLLVSDRRIADLHQKFMGIAGPTDVITFQHGEIFVSVETAARQAAEFRTSLERELRLYVVHGILHLLGFEDTTEAAAHEMERAQEQVLAAVQ